MPIVTEYGSANSVFSYFEEISKIPHGSGNTEKIADYLVNFAKEQGLYFNRDAANNVLIKKPPTPGYEGRPAVILQGHTDMVAEKIPGAAIDMASEGLKIYRDGDYLRAEGTTLGGDDGIAVAYALSILADKELEHPPLEALFTSDEEIGLIGAGAFDTSLLSGRTLINIDSEEEGIFTLGCAGGVRVDFTRKCHNTEECSANRYKLSVSGLLGGHSGVEIDKGRANAAKLAAEVLDAACDVRIITMQGGAMDNAIMRDITCEFFSGDNYDALSEKTAAFNARVIKEYGRTDSGISVKLELCHGGGCAYTAPASQEIISMLLRTPSGVIKMSEDIKGLPETSANIGIVRVSAAKRWCNITVSLRSSITDEKTALKAELCALAEELGFSVSERGDYPAWEYKKLSPLRDEAVALYREMYGKEPVLLTIHAGLECGIFAGKIDGLDCISIGPDMCDIHTTEERLSISSSVRVYEFLTRLLKRIK